MKINNESLTRIVFIGIMIAFGFVITEIIRVAGVIIDASKISGDYVGIGIGAILLNVPTILIVGIIGVGHLLIDIEYKGTSDSDE